MEVMEMMSYKCNKIIYRIPRALHEVRTCVFCFELYLGNWHRLGYIVDAHFIYVTFILHILYAKTVMCLLGINSFNQRNICRLHDCYSFIHYMKNIKHLLMCLFEEEILLEPWEQWVVSFILRSIHSCIHPYTHLFTKYLYFSLTLLSWPTIIILNKTQGQLALTSAS